jgi:hypothetical protein
MNVLFGMDAGVNRREFEEDGKASEFCVSDLIFVSSV